MAIIRESVNLTAGLAETIYTVPTGKQAVISISIANASDTYIAIQTSDPSSAPDTTLDTTFGNGAFSYFSNDVGYRRTANNLTTTRYYALDKFAQDGDSYQTSTQHQYQLPLTSSFNYDSGSGRTRFYDNDYAYRPNGAFDSTGQVISNNLLSGRGTSYDGGAVAVSASEGLMFEKNNGDYTMINNLSSTPTFTTVTSGHFFDLVSSGTWDPATYAGSNLYVGNSTQYIYCPLKHTSSGAPAVVMWDNGDIDHSTSETESKGYQFQGVDDSYVVWVQESGGHTMLATYSDDPASSTSGTAKLWLITESCWSGGTQNGMDTGGPTATNITNANWTGLNSTPHWIKPFVNGNGKKWSFTNPSDPYPVVYDSDAGTWSTSPESVSYPSEISGLSSLGTAYSIYKYSTTLNDYYIVAGDDLYTLTANYEALSANSPFASELQGSVEKGGLTLKAGDKLIAYDKTSGGVVVHLYGYEEDA